MIEPFRQFVDPQRWGADRDGNRLDKLAGLAVLAAIVEEEILQRQATAHRPPAQMQGRPHGDQGRRAIADGRAIGDIAADGGRVADLQAGIAAQHFGKGRVQGEHGLQQGLNRHPRADPQGVALRVDALEIGQLAKEGGFRQIAQLFGDPQAHIRGPGDQGSVGVGGIPVGKRVKVAWAEMSGGRLPPGPRGYLRHVEGIGLHPVRHRGGLSSLGGADDWGVAGAAAEVACKHRVMVLTALQLAHRHRDAKARRAEPALAAVMGDHGGLHRVVFAFGAAEPLNRADGFAIQLRQKQDAGVQRAGAAVIGHHHGASAAIALIAALFGAAKAFCLAQIVQKRLRRRLRHNADRRSVQQKRDL